MWSRNKPEKDPKASKPVDDDAVVKAPDGDKRELTDDEIAAVAGGMSINFTKIEQT